MIRLVNNARALIENIGYDCFIYMEHQNQSISSLLRETI